MIAGFLVLFLFKEPSELKVLIPGKGKKRLRCSFDVQFILVSLESASKPTETRARMTIMEVYHLP